MRITLGVLSTFILAGCAGSPPKPASVQGEYRPVNQLTAFAPAPGAAPVAARTTPLASATGAPTKVHEAPPQQPAAGVDFFFEGDIRDSLHALKKVYPQLTVWPMLGQPKPKFIKLDLKGTSLKAALRALGTAGGADVDIGFFEPKTAAMMTYVSSAPVQATDPKIDWEILESDGTLQKTLARWAQVANWDVRWEGVPDIHNRSYVKLPNLDFLDVAEYVFSNAKTAAKAAGIELEITAYPNRVLVISRVEK